MVSGAESAVARADSRAALRLDHRLALCLQIALRGARPVSTQKEIDKNGLEYI